jgi:2-C-methyl-D-erythritol 4-phosphate cytidylyltransferase
MCEGTGMDDPDDIGTAVGIVPVEGRGSLPFALLHGESLVAVASWALGDAGVELLDFNAAWADVQARDAALGVHDPLCPGTPSEFLARAVDAATDGTVVVGVRPVTDTVKAIADGVLGDTVDREGLVVVASPVVIPAAVVASLPELPDLDDLAVLVTQLRQHHQVTLLEAPPQARRVSDESDLRLLAELPD